MVQIRNPHFTDVADQKRKQQEDHDRSARESEAEVEPPEGPPAPRRCQEFVGAQRLFEATRPFPADLRGRTVLVVCGGQGNHGVRELVRRGAEVLLTDLSPEALARAREKWCHFPQVRFQEADAEHLPFADGSFDYSYCHAGLHHLPRPALGIFEMYRVARRGLVFVEAHDSAALRLLVLLGVAEDWEPSGNYVHRFDRRELHKLCASLGVERYEVRTFFNQFSSFLDRRVYPLFNHPPGLLLFKAFYAAFNLVLGWQGNMFVAWVEKRGGPGR
jgi:ubiquinone/menaquinone biosynthesis C-methylase UbiE